MHSPVPLLGGGRGGFFASPFLPAILLSIALLSPIAVCAQQVDPGAYQRVIEENLDLRRQQERLGKDLDNLRRQNAALILDVQDLERKREQLTGLISQLKTPDDTREEIVRLQAEKVVLSKEIERLRQALGSIRVAPTNVPDSTTAVPAAGSDLFRKLEQENSALRQEIVTARGTMQAEVEAGTRFKQRIGELENELRRVEGEAAKAKEDAGRVGKVSDAFRVALEKMARRAHQQEQEIRDLKAKTAGGTTGESGSVSRVAGKKGKVVEDRTGAGMLRAAEKALQDGKPEVAEKLYLDLLARDGRSARVHYNLGVLYDDYLKQPRKAAQYYRQYLELNPDAADAAAVRVWILDLESRM